MLSFISFDGQRPGVSFPLRHTTLVGPDGVGVGAEIHLDDGIIHCAVPPASSSAGLSLQVPLESVPAAPDGGPVPALGRLTLRTCLLPPCERPYLLSVELARHRIMTFLNKLEDWALFDLPSDDPILLQFERARQTFTAALVAERAAGEAPGGHSPSADRLGWEALALAIDAGEQLALRNAERELERRLSGRAYAEAAALYQQATGDPPPNEAPIIVQNSVGVTLAGRPQVGVTVSPSQFAEPFQRAAEQSAEFISLPMRWIDMEPEEGEYSFTGTDRWIEWAVRRARLPVHAGPVIDFRASAVPDWLYIWENDYDTLRELVHDHLKAIVTRYRRTVSRWTIASGLHVNSNFKLSYEQIMDLTRLCVLLVRKLQPGAKVQLEIDQPWGEYYAISRQSIPPTLYADAVAQSGIAVDAYALRLTIGSPDSGCSTRDLMELSSILDRYAALERPIFVTALGAPSRTLVPPDTQDCEPGYWRAPWSEPLQASWLAAAAPIILGKPFVLGMTWRELADTPGQPSFGLVSAEGQPKPVLARLAGIRAAIREGRTSLGQSSLPAALTT